MLTKYVIKEIYFEDKADQDYSFFEIQRHEGQFSEGN